MAADEIPRAKKFLRIEALAAVREGRIDEGISKYKEYLSIEQNKDDAHAWAGLGGAYRRAEDINQAIEHYQKAYELDPRSTYALVNLVSLLAARNDPRDRQRLTILTARAEDLCKEAISAGVSDQWTWYDLATLQLIAGKKEEATASFSYAAELTPKNARENFRSVLSNLNFLNRNNPSIKGMTEVMGQIESYLIDEDSNPTSATTH